MSEATSFTTLHSDIVVLRLICSSSYSALLFRAEAEAEEALEEQERLELLEEQEEEAKMQAQARAAGEQRQAAAAGVHVGGSANGKESSVGMTRAIDEEDL